MYTPSPSIVAHGRDQALRGLMPASIDKRMRLLVRTERALGGDLLTATTEDLRRFLEERNLSGRTRYAYISHWASFWRWAVLEFGAEHDPTLRLQRPKLRLGLPRPVATQDLERALEQSPSAELSAMILLAAHAGLRCMEIAGLDAGDVMTHAEPPVIVVSHGKGDRPRVVPLSPALIDALRRHGVPHHGPVFRYRGGVYPAWKVSAMLRQHLHDCNIEASGHQLRHAFATEVYRRSGGDLRMTQELLGHSSPTSTAIYAAWAQDKAAAVIASMFPAA